MSFRTRERAAPAASPGSVLVWEEPNCLLCGSRRWHPLLEAPDNLAGSGGLWFAVVKCQDCGLCFTNPRPDAQSIGRFYPAGYWPQRAPGPDLTGDNQGRPLRRWCRPWKERRLLSRHRHGRLLDFGCGEGAFLDRMDRNGWDVTGLDAFPAPVHRIRARLGLPVLVGTLPHPQLRPASFDVITMWQSLEHVHYPREVLQEAHDLLAPGGKLLVAVPNIESVPFAWFGQSWFGLDLPRHLTHFSPVTLRWMLERTGFRVGPVRMIRQSGWMRASAHIASQGGRKLRSDWLRLFRNKHVSRLGTWYTYFTQQCDCLMVTAERAK